MRLDKPLTWARTAQTPNINYTIPAHTLKLTQSLTHTIQPPPPQMQLSPFFFLLPDILANLTVFQQIGGFNIRLVDFRSQMFFVQKNGLQCFKFVCDPGWITCAAEARSLIRRSSLFHLLPLSFRRSGAPRRVPAHRIRIRFTSSGRTDKLERGPEVVVLICNLFEGERGGGSQIRRAFWGYLYSNWNQNETWLNPSECRTHFVFHQVLFQTAYVL